MTSGVGSSEASQVVLVVKNPLANAGNKDVSSIPGSGRSPGGGHGNPLQYCHVWGIPWTEEPGGLQSMASKESNMTEATWHACTRDHPRQVFRPHSSNLHET